MCWAVARSTLIPCKATLHGLLLSWAAVGVGGLWFPVKEDVSLVWSYSNHSLAHRKCTFLLCELLFLLEGPLICVLRRHCSSWARAWDRG